MLYRNRSRSFHNSSSNSQFGIFRNWTSQPDAWVTAAMEVAADMTDESSPFLILGTGMFVLVVLECAVPCATPLSVWSDILFDPEPGSERLRFNGCPSPSLDTA